MLRNEHFDNFVRAAKGFAAKKGLAWDQACEPDGRILQASRWDLDRLVGAPARGNQLPHLVTDDQTLAWLNSRRSLEGHAPLLRQMLSCAWRDLVQAVVIDFVCVQRNLPRSALYLRVRPLRVLATCALGTEPWEITVDHVRTALEAASTGRATDSLRSVVETVVGAVLDLNHLTNRTPLLRAALRGQPRACWDTKREKGQSDIRVRLADRKSGEKLPDMRAFSELVRIIFTEEPATFRDALTFEQCKVLICTGFRVTEACLLPADWRRQRSYVTAEGRAAGEVGGISTSLMIRHFAEKKRGRGEDSVVLYEAMQHVPHIFEDIVEEALGSILQRTASLRSRLAQQIESGRLFPEFGLDQLIPATEVYTRLTGDLRLVDDELPQKMVSEYRRTYDPQVLGRIWQQQNRPGAQLRHVAAHYFYQFGRGAAGGCNPLKLPACRPDGSAWEVGVSWSQAYVRVRDLEEFVCRAMPRKVSNQEPYRLSGGKLLFPHELLLLCPKGSVTEDRNSNVCDTTRYFSVTQIGRDYVWGALGGRENNLFSRYGRTDEDRKLALARTHAIRHLQNTELFRLGLADTIISKRFNRRSVQQSYVYDHRSLAEDLDAIELPVNATDRLPPRAQHVLKLIQHGKVRGPLIEEFERIQRLEGEDAAFEYLAVEADGFHATPYGICVNSFTVDPCPKHLECFNGCRHLAISGNPEDQVHLSSMARRLETAIAAIEGKPPGSIGRENQLREARSKLKNVRRAIEVMPGEQPFPDGDDLSDLMHATRGKSLLDVF